MNVILEDDSERDSPTTYMTVQVKTRKRTQLPVTLIDSTRPADTSTPTPQPSLHERKPFSDRGGIKVGCSLPRLQ